MSAERTAVRIVFVVAAVLGVLGIGLLRAPREAPQAGEAAVASAALPEVSAAAPRAVASEAPHRARALRPAVRAPAPGPERAGEPAEGGPNGAVDARDAAFWRETAGIEDFKQAIYALDIDSIDEIPLLDDLVHVEVEDPLTLWDTDWAGVDDWKRYRDGFSLERGPGGSLLFHPGEETQRMFTFFETIAVYEYDESNQAFVNRVDYYGKPIFNVVKFLREDVLVMMTISGHKVDLSIFGQGDYR